MACDLTVTVTVTKRPLLNRLARFPFVAHKHYRLLRRHGNGRLFSLCAAWTLAGVIVRVS